MDALQLTATAVFAASVAAIVYVLAIYPPLVAFLAHRHTKPVRKDDVLRTVSVIMAVRNGEQFLAAKLRSLLASDYPAHLMDIAVVSDGSDDRTDSIALSFAAQGVRLYRNQRRGKGAAVNTGVSHAVGELLILTDVRQTIDSRAIRNVVACFGDPTVGAVSGELSIRQGLSAEEADTGLYWRYEVFIRKQMSRLDSTFGANGPFYGMRRSLAVTIPEDTLLDDVYLPLAAFFQGYRLILEESAKVVDYPTNLGSEFRRKVRTQAGLYQIVRLYPQLLSGKNRMRFHFVSGKFGRLLMPFMLLAAAISSFGLASPLREIVVSIEAFFCLMAAADLLVPQNLMLKSLTSPARTFVVLMFAGLIALQVFFVPPRALWKETGVRTDLPENIG